MSSDERHAGQQGRSTRSRPRRRFARLQAVLLTWLSIAAAPVLWSSVDSAAAMTFRGGHPAVHTVGHRQALHATTHTSRVGSVNNGYHWGNRHPGSHLGSRIVVLPKPVPPVPPNKPPYHHPITWPHRPIVFGSPQGPSAPVGVTSVAPPGPPGPSGPNVGPGVAGGGGPPAAAATNSRFVPDEVLVTFAGNISRRAIIGFAQDQRLAPLSRHALPLINTVMYRFRITDRREVPTVVGGLRGDRRIATVQPNYIYTLQDDGASGAAIGDPMQYVVDKLHLRQAHDLATGNHVLVAVIDSGIDTQHPELNGAVAGGFDAFTGDLKPQKHGTAMAGAIVAHGRLMGVAPAARILAVRAFDSDAAGSRSTTSRLVDALQWTANSTARVVNMSFTGPDDPGIRSMVAALRQKGMVLVAAAGNDGPQAPADYPAAYPGVIAVTATDIDDHLLSVANHGAYVAVAAPGVDIFVAAPNGGYGFTTGTSVATAHVSGLAALLLQRNPRLTPDAVQAVLMGSAKALGANTVGANAVGVKGRNDEYGAGLIDAYAALLAIAPPTAVSKR